MNEVLKFPEGGRDSLEKPLTNQEIDEGISSLELDIKNIQRKMEALEVEEADKKQQLAWLKEERDKNES